jgi:fungal STAND N-terminal Goodbye domain
MSFMASTSMLASNLPTIIDAALDEYTKQTGINLAQNPFSHKIHPSDSPDDILALFQEREKEFKEYRDGNRNLISCLKPVVQILHALAGVLGQVISLMNLTSFISPTCLFIDYIFSHFHQQKLSLLELMFSSRYAPSIIASSLILLTRQYVRLLVVLVRAMTHSKTYSDAFRIFFNAYKFIPRFLSPPR